MRDLVLESDPGDDCTHEEARILMLRVGFALLNDARRDGGFETDEATMAEQVRDILISLGTITDADASEVPVTAVPDGRSRVLLSVSIDKVSILGAVMRSDGVLLEEYSSAEITAEEVDSADSPQELPEQRRRARGEQETRARSLQFRGERLLRVLTVDPQPESPVQFLAVEFFSDGLVIHYTYDEGLDPSELTMSGQTPASIGRSSGVFVEDDLGSKYFEYGGGAGGAGAIHATAVFVPAVPEDARMLRLACAHGAVEKQL